MMGGLSDDEETQLAALHQKETEEARRMWAALSLLLAAYTRPLTYTECTQLAAELGIVSMWRQAANDLIPMKGNEQCPDSAK